jgi:energy-coupling factor transport system permease protein
MNNVFSTYHPAVSFLYLVVAVVFSMAALHPVYVALSFVGAFATSCVTRGCAKTLRALAWIVPLWVIVALANLVLSGSGMTELFSIGSYPFYVESLVYGMCSGGMLASVFLWFASYSECMDSDNSLALLGNVAPVISLMVTQVLRLVPQFLTRGHAALAVQKATSAAVPRDKKEQAQGRLRIVSILMGWGMEDGLERSDAMRARGYDCGVKRTTYKRYRFAAHDAVVVAAVVVLAAANGFLAWVACSQFTFYPTVSTLVVWWGYIPYLLLMVLPLILQVKEWLLWHSLR